jgi:hypothetical protein
VSTNEELQVSRFRYGSDRQLIVVQAKSDSNWQTNEPRIVVAKRNGRGLTGIHKVWRFYDSEDEIPAYDHNVRYIVDEDIRTSQTPVTRQNNPQTELPHAPAASTCTQENRPGS